ncbi:MAG: hypothetical protein ACJ0SL_00960 [Candidatus Rariloculaceae bacterium]
MRFLQTFTAIFSFCLGGIAGAQGFEKFTSELDRFEIFTPVELSMSEMGFDTEYGAVVPARVYAGEDGPNRYMVTVVDYTDARRIHAERDKTEADYVLYWEVDVRASIAYAATNIRNRGGDITFDAYHYIDRVEGHQLQITNDDQSRTYAAIYLHDSKLYIVEATVVPGSPPPGFFQQSLQWIDAEGDRIRYQNYTDAIKVRDPDIRD